MVWFVLCFYSATLCVTRPRMLQWTGACQVGDKDPVRIALAAAIRIRTVRLRIQWTVVQFKVSQKILIVEDEKALRRNLEMFLGELGHKVRCAACGEDAVRLLHHEQFDIVITDIRLGDMDGLDLVRRINSRSSLTGVLVMTAYGSPDSATEAFRSGAHDYILKPFPLDEIEQRINNIARYLDLQRQNAILREEIQRHR